MNFILDFGVKSALTLGFAFLLALALRKASASVRYALWTCVLAAVLLLPLLSWIGPARTVDTGAWRRATVRPAPQSQVRPPVAVVVQGKRSPAPRDWLTILWLAGMAAMTLRIGAGHWRLRTLIRSAKPFGLGVKLSMSVDVPLSYGSTIVLPADARNWAPERLAVVLAHEGTHVRRRDSLWGLVAQLALAVNWFNPLAFLASREFRREQERSCDDAVVMSGVDKSAYAAYLVDLARSVALPEPALGIAERFDLQGRVHALLDANRTRSEASPWLRAAMFTVAFALIVPLAAIHAQPAAASLTGTVYDPSGAVVPNATVRIKASSGPGESMAYAGAAGFYQLKNLAPGEYALKVTVPGFAAYQKTVQVNGAMTLDVNLALGDVTESVVITGKKPQQAAPSTAAPQRIRVGGNVQAVKLISKVNPSYPEDAQAEGVEGTVMLKAVISKDGSLLSISPVSNGIDPRLVRAAMAAVPLWRYQPTLLNGEPVEVITTIAVIFKLN